MSIEIRAACGPGEVRIAVLRDRVLNEYRIWRPAMPDGVGDIYRGRIVKLVPALGGAFVRVGEADGFLPDTEGAKGLTEGTILTVRVTRAAQAGKGPRLAAEADGDGPVGLVRRGEDPLTWLLREWPDSVLVVDDAALLAHLGLSLGSTVSLTDTAFDDELSAEIDTLAEREVALPGGGRMSIHVTPALTAIDVDSGSSLGARVASAEHHLRFNRAAIPAIVRQVRLRNLSGVVLIDFAGMPMRRRAVLAPDLRAALAEDPVRPRLLGFSHTGLAEVLRPRVHAPLHEVLRGPLAAGLAALRGVVARVQETRRMPMLIAAPDVVGTLRADPAAIADVARLTGRTLTMQADPALPAGQWRLDNPDG